MDKLILKLTKFDKTEWYIISINNLKYYFCKYTHNIIIFIYNTVIMTIKVLTLYAVKL